MALMHVQFFSEVLGLSVSMDAIIPQAAKGQIGMGGAAAGGPYQTLYLLHGMSDDHTIWQRRTSVERYVSELGLAVIMPTTQLGWYTDMSHGLKWWTYISEELPGICRRFFPLSHKREDTFAAGLSMGGYGALKLGLAAGEAFSRVASLSGGILDAETLSGRSSGDGRGSTLWEDVFGDAEAFAGSANDLYALAERRARGGKFMPKVYMCCGTEDPLYPQNAKFRDHLRDWGYDLTYEEGPGTHEWGYWDKKIQSVLEWLAIEGKSH
ncbi:MAG: esterase family protein [Clostridiales bacterium]|nr:esterase family protein [Clostridiales bacterium]